MKLPWLPDSPWVPCTAPLTSGTAIRNPGLLESIVAQFRVETSTRYQPRDGKTYCNVFSWDWSRAVGAELPHWRQVWSKEKNCMVAKEMNVNETSTWLEKIGPRHGWTKASQTVAVATASMGKPAVALWVNPSGPGHIAVLVPSKDSQTVEIAQAGAKNFSRGTLLQGFGPRSVSFYVHP